jgi:uncharacterized protein (DUF1697 family)
MPVVIAMLRGVNLGKQRRIDMKSLRELYVSQELQDVRTYVQSGNVVFRSGERNLAHLAARLERAFERGFGFRSDVFLRTSREMRDVVSRNPFSKRRDVDPSKLLVTFLGRDPGDAARAQVRAIETHPEVLYIDGREIYVYFPDGIGRSKRPWKAIDKALGTLGTTRNWNTVTKLLEMAESLEAESR